MMNSFDPSKIDPKLLMELSQLVQKLPPEQLSRMQTLMHNAMAGFDVRKEMEEFEKNLPADFRIRLATLMANQPMEAPTTQGNPEIEDAEYVDSDSPPTEVGLRQARLTILRAVAEGQMSPENAEKLLFAAS